MRKAYGLALLMVCAACSLEADDEKSSVAGQNPSGAGEASDDAEHGADGDRASGLPVLGGPSGGTGGVAMNTASTVPASPAPAGAVVPSVGAGGAVASSEAAPASSGAAIPISPTDPIAPTEPTVSPVRPVVQSGQLTAGAWDDNLNFERFKQFHSSVAQHRQSGILPITNADLEAAHERFSAPRAAHQQLDVALVIDTTGSMGDEISYLQREFTDLSSAIESAYPGAEQRWALVAYKDVGDEYLTRQFDFRSDLTALRADLLALRAGGGGDFPEAPDAAFAQLNQMSWRSGEGVARLAFWIADAPHQDTKASAMATELRSAQGKDIHVYPVASSGLDEFTELGMRTAAQLTGGRYLFLTNDSGIGGSHKEPSIPCYFVTRLDQAILRMIKIEMTGAYSEPLPEQIIRTGGDPKDGACTLQSGELTVF